jgi:hypothetical protein
LGGVIIKVIIITQTTLPNVVFQCLNYTSTSFELISVWLVESLAIMTVVINVVIRVLVDSCSVTDVDTKMKR